MYWPGPTWLSLVSLGTQNSEYSFLVLSLSWCCNDLSLELAVSLAALVGCPCVPISTRACLDGGLAMVNGSLHLSASSSIGFFK